VENIRRLTASIEQHSTCALKIVLCAFLLDCLLRDDIAGAEEEGCGDGLGQQRSRG
jgi:hypothetical protein